LGLDTGAIGRDHGPSCASPLAVAYFVHLFRSFAGKVAPGGSDHGY